MANPHSNRTEALYLLCKVGPYTCAFPCEIVERVQMAEQLGTLPSVPDFVRGFILHGGQPVPVIDLRRRFGLEPTSLTLHTRLVIVRLSNRPVAFLCDSAHEIRSLPTEIFTQPKTEDLPAPLASFIKQVAPTSEGWLLIPSPARIVEHSERL